MTLACGNKRFRLLTACPQRALKLDLESEPVRGGAKANSGRVR